MTLTGREISSCQHSSPSERGLFNWMGVIWELYYTNSIAPLEQLCLYIYNIYIYMYIYIYMQHIYTHTHTYIYIHIHRIHANMYATPTTCSPSNSIRPSCVVLSLAMAAWKLAVCRRLSFRRNPRTDLCPFLRFFFFFLQKPRAFRCQDWGWAPVWDKARSPSSALLRFLF